MPLAVSKRPGGSTSPASRLPLPVSRFPSPASRLPLPVSRFPSPVSRLPSPASRLALFLPVHPCHELAKPVREGVDFAITQVGCGAEEA